MIVFNRSAASRIMHINRIIATISKNIVSNNILICTQYSVLVHKPLSNRVVVSGVEVVEPGFGIIAIAAVAEGIERAYGVGFGAGDRQKLAPRAVFVVYHTLGIVVYYRYDVALRVVKVE